MHPKTSLSTQEAEMRTFDNWPKLCQGIVIPPAGLYPGFLVLGNRFTSTVFDFFVVSITFAEHVMWRQHIDDSYRIFCQPKNNFFYLWYLFLRSIAVYRKQQQADVEENNDKMTLMI